jgi:hypothetical protein
MERKQMKRMMKERRAERRAAAAQRAEAFAASPGSTDFEDVPVCEDAPNTVSFRWALDSDHGTAAS